MPSTERVSRSWPSTPGSRTDQFAAPQALPIDLDEGGEQTTITGHEAAYDGTAENVIPISEAQQAANHVVLAEIAACDPTVKALLFFQLIDNTGVSTGFQSGNLYADLTPKQSYADVKSKIASAQGLCQGGLTGIASRGPTPTRCSAQPAASAGL